LRFKTLDRVKDQEYETQIINVDSDASNQFVQSWVAFYIMKILRDPDFSYTLFKWDKIIKGSFVVGSKYQCYGAFTGKRLDGLLSLSLDDILKIEFIATAPWNYGENGRVKRIGSALICFTIQMSQYCNRRGEFMLNAIPDAEKFYERIGMQATGNANPSGLKEYHMSETAASSFIKENGKYII